MANKEPGYVYILTNPSFREDWVKIGKTINMEERLRTLYNTSLPLPFEVFATMKTTKYNEAEKLVHHYIERFTNLRIEKKREFFNVKPEEALEIFREVATLLDDAVIEEVYKTGLTCEADKESKKEVRKAGENRVWLIPYNKKFYDLKGCFDKIGEVYWTQHFHFKAGDTGYIYGAAPESAIRFSFKIKEADLPYDPVMDQDNEFVKEAASELTDIEAILEKQSLEEAFDKLASGEVDGIVAGIDYSSRDVILAGKDKLGLVKPEVKLSGTPLKGL